jgi:hypothetical protein
MTLGTGEYRLGLVATGITAGVLFGLAYAEALISNWRVTTRFKLKVGPSVAVALEIKHQIRNMGIRIRTSMITNIDAALTPRISATAPSRKLDKPQMMLMSNKPVHTLKRV